jgi:hypothetical protein
LYAISFAAFLRLHKQKRKEPPKANLQSKANWVEVKWRLREQLAMKVDGGIGWNSGEKLKQQHVQTEITNNMITTHTNKFQA